ncbi:hypothetical protein LX36DRAFT_664529 [Colletotrichum falcatum]|nr:hypothetical protein LX36DRAFT_664529 [Colletotrichum falcatum]
MRRGSRGASLTNPSSATGFKPGMIQTAMRCQKPKGGSIPKGEETKTREEVKAGKEREWVLPRWRAHMLADSSHSSQEPAVPSPLRRGGRSRRRGGKKERKKKKKKRTIGSGSAEARRPGPRGAPGVAGPAKGIGKQRRGKKKRVLISSLTRIRCQFTPRAKLPLCRASFQRHRSNKHFFPPPPPLCKHPDSKFRPTPGGAMTRIGQTSDARDEVERRF